jgi:hypothetical protein
LRTRGASEKNEPHPSIITYNIWLTDRWPARAPALERFLTLFTPDVLCVQELQRATQEFLDRVLRGYRRVHDPFPGWTNESKIYWNQALMLDTQPRGGVMGETGSPLGRGCRLRKPSALFAGDGSPREGGWAVGCGATTAHDPRSIRVAVPNRQRVAMTGDFLASKDRLRSLALASYSSALTT